ncbi:MAG: class I SAM-dependent methyltransferase [Fimbriimonadaceae bacterium]|nr:class I SAM-dependent methyltransferase [Alphaproteobacteria bacterium]
MQQATKFWDSKAEKYAKSSIRDMDAYNYTLERTRSYLAQNDRVLEVGCGTGSTALLLASNAGHIIASDLSPNMIAIATEKAREQGVSNISFVAADLFDRMIDGEPYDAIMAFNVLHLLEDTANGIRRINELLKPGGTFISKTVCLPESGIHCKLQFMRMVLPLMQMLGMAPYVNLMKINELEDIISSQGFKIIETGSYPASPPLRYIVARKVG